MLLRKRRTSNHKQALDHFNSENAQMQVRLTETVRHLLRDIENSRSVVVGGIQPICRGPKHEQALSHYRSCLTAAEQREADAAELDPPAGRSRRNAPAGCRRKPRAVKPNV